MNTMNAWRADRARDRYEDFKDALLGEARHHKGSIVLTDEQIVELTKLSPRTVQRFLKKLRELGDVNVKRHRYWAGQGWCNTRTLYFREEDLILYKHRHGGN